VLVKLVSPSQTVRILGPTLHKHIITNWKSISTETQKKKLNAWWMSRSLFFVRCYCTSERNKQHKKAQIHSRSERTNKPQGEYLYGTQPVLAALLANRRQFFDLYLSASADKNKSNKQTKQKERYLLELSESMCICPNNKNLEKLWRKSRNFIINALNEVRFGQTEALSIDLLGVDHTRLTLFNSLLTSPSSSSHLFDCSRF
jgi:hypothetical protein